MGYSKKNAIFSIFFRFFFSVFSVFLQKILLHCYTKKRTVYLYLYLPNIYSRVPRILGVFFFLGYPSAAGGKDFPMIAAYPEIFDAVG